MKKIFSLFTIFLLIFGSESFAKTKKKPVIKYLDIAIPAEDFLQMNLDQNDCGKFVAGECFRRDHARDEPYYHETRITIFRNRIFAEQFFKRDSLAADKMFLPVKDGFYQITRLNKNLILFHVKDGQVSDLKLLQGDVDNEKEARSKCDVTSAIYGFYQAYKKPLIVDQYGLYKDEFSFDGLKEFMTFIEATNPEKIMAMTKNPNQVATAIDDINLCKMPNSETYLVRHFSGDECKKITEDNIAECSKYSVCEDFLNVQNCEIVVPKSSEQLNLAPENPVQNEEQPQKEKPVQELPALDNSLKEENLKDLTPQSEVQEEVIPLN